MVSARARWSQARWRSMSALARAIVALAPILLAVGHSAAALAQPPYQPWQFRPLEPSNARGVPPPYPGGEPARDATGSPPGQPPAWPPRGQPQSHYGQPGGFQPGAQPQYPYGQPPGQSGYGPPPRGQPQAMQPGQFQPGYRPAPGSGYYGPGALGAGQPQLEVVVGERRPYVQQNVLVRLRVVSFGNLATASPALDGIADVLFEQVDGPNTSTRGSGNRQEIVNEYVVTMTPLRAGPMEVGPIEVSGTLAGGVPFTARTARPVELDVRPPIATLRPWLPLKTLRIAADLKDADGMARGRPATLTVELEAEGAVGSQLPSVESMLRSEDFRVYREQTMTDTRLADSGNTLIGKRIEVYTLVPHSGGRLQLPELRLAWWNVETATREASSVPIRVFNVAGESGPFGFADSAGARTSGDWQRYWLPVAGLGLLLLGYWGGVWLRSRSPGRRAPLWQLVQDGVALTGRGAAKGLALLARALNPAPLLRALRAALARLAPPSTRVYQCARAAAVEDNPAEWCLAFQRQACRRLAATAREPLPRMADRITALRPGADRARVQGLMQELDQALYNRADIDFARWKRDFRRALRPGAGALGSFVSGRVQRAKLPELNPRPAA
jgi:hypothetical protein